MWNLDKRLVTLAAALEAAYLGISADLAIAAKAKNPHPAKPEKAVKQTAPDLAQARAHVLNALRIKIKNHIIKSLRNMAVQKLPNASAKSLKGLQEILDELKKHHPLDRKKFDDICRNMENAAEVRARRSPNWISDAKIKALMDQIHKNHPIWKIPNPSWNQLKEVISKFKPQKDGDAKNVIIMKLHAIAANNTGEMPLLPLIFNSDTAKIAGKEIPLSPDNFRKELEMFETLLQIELKRRAKGISVEQIKREFPKETPTSAKPHPERPFDPHELDPKKVPLYYKMDTAPARKAPPPTKNKRVQ